MSTDEHWMQLALKCADKAADQGEVPIGAVLVLDNQLIAKSYNQSILSNDASAHAEINVIRAAGQVLGNYRLVNTVLYTTLEPCLMCAGSLAHARIARCVYGANDPKGGALGSVTHAFELNCTFHKLEVTSGVLAQACGDKLSQFFKQRRADK